MPDLLVSSIVVKVSTCQASGVLGSNFHLAILRGLSWLTKCACVAGTILVKLLTVPSLGPGG